MKKKILSIIFISFCCITAFSQNTKQAWSETKKFEYNGWKIKTGENLATPSGDSLTIKKMQWYSINGENVVLADVVSSKGVEQINIRQWIDDDKILLPPNISKLDAAEHFVPDGISQNGDTIISGYEMFRAFKLAGNELSIFHQRQMVGNTLLLIGAGGVLAGSILTISEAKTISATSSDAGVWVAAAGAGISLIGWIVNITATKHIGNAGQYFQGIIPLNTGKKKVRYL